MEKYIEGTNTGETGMKGIVFDIKEFAVYDGPGIRTTVFMKGCPLRCRWCHNPEGLSVKPQLMVSKAACTGCGKCRGLCEDEENCTACGRCIPRCPGGYRKLAGREMTSQELAEKLRRSAVFEDGGVTFSGGEPMLQWEFVKETCGYLGGIHKAIETSGFCSDRYFSEMLGTMDLVMMDLKHTDPAEHRRWTGVDNAAILRHLEMLKKGDTPYIIRIPLIPGVNDTEENISASAGLIAGGRKLVRVELLPYHQTAGAKYSMAGMEYDPGFDTHRPVDKHMEIFEKMGLPVISLT